MKKVIYSRFSFKSRDKAFVKALYNSLHPDNLSQPRDVRIVDYIVEEPDGSTLVIEVKTEYVDKFDTVKGTIDEVLTLLNAVSKLK